MDFENENSPNYYSSSPSSVSQNSPSDSSHEKTIVSKTHGKFKETRHPIYRGIRQRNGKKWVCEVREPNKKTRIWLGTYPIPEMAARAHDVAILALKGTSAVLNFPESASLLIPLLPSTNSPADIREAASKAAKAFPPTLSTSSSSFNNLSVEITNPCDDLNNVNRSLFEQEEIMNNDDEYNKSMFFDEEVLYNMPGFLDSMAEGLLITPPSMKKALDWDQVECEMDLTLWTD